MPKRYYFREWYRARRWPIPGLEVPVRRLRHGAINEAWVAYRNNVDIAMNIPLALYAAFGCGMNAAQIKAEARRRVYGSYENWVNNSDVRLGQKCMRLEKREYDGRIKLEVKKPMGVFELEPFVRLQRAKGVDLDALMYSQIVSMCTCFETLCGDLWGAAIALRPSCKARSIKNKKPRDKQFQSLPKIVEAYRSICAPPSITDILGSQGVGTLFAMRHLIIHKSALVDREYLSNRRKFPNLPRAKMKQKLPINGKIILELIPPFRNAGADLVAEVDQWI